MKEPYPHIILKPGKERTLKNRHPWVFSGAIAKKDDSLKNGEVVELYSHQGDYLATGHFHDSTISIRILTFQKQAIDAVFFKKRFLESIEYRKQTGLWENAETNMFRMVHGEGDLLSGLIVDVYGDNAVIHAHSDGMHESREMLAATLNEASGQRFKTIYYQKEAGKHGYPSSRPAQMDGLEVRICAVTGGKRREGNVMQGHGDRLNITRPFT